MNITLAAVQTERLMLRPYQMSDLETFNQVVNANKEHLMEFMPWATYLPCTLEQHMAYLKNCIGDYYKDLDYTMGVFLKDSETFIGACGLHKRHQDTKILELGYWISEAHINKGYATELSFALTQLAFEILKAEKVELKADLDNTRSQKIPKKLNFKLEGHEYLTSFKADKRSVQVVFGQFKEDFKPIPPFKTNLYYPFYTTASEI